MLYFCKTSFLAKFEPEQDGLFFFAVRRTYIVLTYDDGVQLNNINPQSGVSVRIYVRFYILHGFGGKDLLSLKIDIDIRSTSISPEAF